MNHDQREKVESLLNRLRGMALHVMTVRRDIAGSLLKTIEELETELAVGPGAP